MSTQIRLTRRLALGALGVAAAAVLAVRELRLLPRRAYRASPYDDLLSNLADRDAAASVGTTLLASFDPEAAAAQLRRKTKGRSFERVAFEDVSDGRVVEAALWVMPQSLALLCALAAKES